MNYAIRPVDSKFSPAVLKELKSVMVLLNFKKILSTVAYKAVAYKKISVQLKLIQESNSKKFLIKFFVNEKF